MMAQKKIDEILKDPQFQQKKKIFDMEIQNWRDSGYNMPLEIRPRDWVQLLRLKSLHQRRKFLNYLFLTEKKVEKKKEIKDKNRLEYESKLSVKKVNDDHLEYGIGNNFMIRRVTPSVMSKLYVWNCLKGYMFGNKIIFDCSFSKYMSIHESRSCARQFIECYAANRLHNFPFHIYMCNVDVSSDFIEFLHRYIPTLFDVDFPMTITTKTYLELFDKSELVYLSSNSHVEMTEYNPNITYIIGAFVDKGDKQPISRAKAIKDNIKYVKLPLDKYLRFGDGSGKDLTINHVYNIMLDAQIKDWKDALKHVPSRKLYSSRIISLENKVKSEMLLKSLTVKDNVDDINDRNKLGESRNKFFKIYVSLMV
ncbi:PREDICTED: mitochondrial ribonuclease P protein 1 homolog [Ceratosolen solmsi marchali]|uniref:RNA (guanine-9-)-methyltransferase domain-containing protein 1 n=1 Tax=Ceratosolen solmsi marchali TaxID=326594 RepID=A0AAJ7DXQ8_9HYME|nr:PREDICTED: mitochondrial ribonuclease P protein 1 homolog [Ceratosolen solmsi marchali]